MNKSLILVASACLVAVVVVQVSAQFGATGFGTIGTGLGGGVSQDAYYRRYEAYNNAQQLRVLRKTVSDLSFSSTLSLSKYSCFVLFFSKTLGWNLKSYYVQFCGFLILCFWFYSFSPGLLLRGYQHHRNSRWLGKKPSANEQLTTSKENQRHFCQINKIYIMYYTA